MKARYRLAALPLAAVLLSACSPFTRIEGDAFDPQKFLRAGVRLSSG